MTELGKIETNRPEAQELTAPVATATDMAAASLDTVVDFHIAASALPPAG